MCFVIIFVFGVFLLRFLFVVIIFVILSETSLDYFLFIDAISHNILVCYLFHGKPVTCLFILPDSTIALTKFIVLFDENCLFVFVVLVYLSLQFCLSLFLCLYLLF